MVQSIKGSNEVPPHSCISNSHEKGRLNDWTITSSCIFKVLSAVLAISLIVGIILWSTGVHLALSNLIISGKFFVFVSTTGGSFTAITFFMIKLMNDQPSFPRTF